jgi:hypothetical protein
MKWQVKFKMFLSGTDKLFPKEICNDKFYCFLERNRHKTVFMFIQFSSLKQFIYIFSGTAMKPVAIHCSIWEQQSPPAVRGHRVCWDDL